MSKLKLFVFLSLLALSLAGSDLKDVTLVCEEWSKDSCLDEKSPCRLYCKLPWNTGQNEELNVTNIELKHEHKKTGNGEILLDFDRNRTTSTVPRGLGKAFKGKIITLSLSNFGLTELKRIDFADMLNLKRLNLDSNELNSIPDHTFDNLTKLEFLSLNGNNFNSLNYSTLSPLTNLKVFSAEYNKIKEVKQNIFEKNLIIEDIYLRGNQITKLYINFNSAAFSKLSFVDLRDNSDYCDCEFLDANKSIEKQKMCKGDFFQAELKRRNLYIFCAQEAMTKRNNLNSIEGCLKTKDSSMTNAESDLQSCLKKMKIEDDLKGEEFGKCLQTKLQSENQALYNAESCIREKTMNNKMTRCEEESNEQSVKARDAKKSCEFCGVMSNKETRERCNVFYNKANGDFGDFLGNVTAHFRS